ncbi:hypothetical protein BFJ68_g17560 [Fusarium oxysporum]|uniref:CHAT domain-containing protein n=1 Tax=Fusarium oxysporum TaxID=5507 RepID=A0A420NPK1_FUSOX|nr:hypothetical protein BFJ68_g17560 [Fusarium oxysporum]
MADLEESIQVAWQAVDAAPERYLNPAIYFNDLGVALGDKYLRTGAIADLDEAIRVTGQALDMTSEDHPKRALYLNNLGSQLHDRYSKTQAMADLEESIQFTRQAVNGASNQEERAGLLHNLGHRLGSRYSRTRAMADLEEAIYVARQAVDITSKDHPNWTMYTTNLGVQLHKRYSTTREMASLEQAIQLARHVVDATPEAHPSRAGHLRNLGHRLEAKYSRTGDIADLNENIQITRQAINVAPKDHPRQADLLKGLGAALMKRFRRTRAVADLEEAIAHLRSASGQSNASAVTRIQACYAIVLASIVTSDWRQGYEASDIAIRLISKVTSRSLEVSDKQHVLRQVAGIASNAAAIALQAEKGASVALRLLEQGRGLLATSLEEMRTDILGLRERYPELADQFVRLRDELEPPATRSADLPDEDQMYSWQGRGTRRYDAGNKLDKAIDEIRKRPRFEDFLTAPSGREMQVAARSGPIIVINVGQCRCDAVLVEEHRIRVLALPYLKSQDIKKKVQSGSLGSPMVLEWLWDVAANPILDALGFLQPPLGDNWPHVW